MSTPPPADINVFPWPTATPRPAVIVGLLVMLTAALYVNSLSASFMLDDWLFAAEDGLLRRTWNWDSPNHLNRLFGTWTLKMNHAYFGQRPWGYRAFNMAVHALAGAALFGLVRRTLLLPGIPARLSTRADALAAATAVLFVVHPLQTESVTYIVQRYEALFGLFFLLTLYFVVRGSQAEKPGAWYFAAWFACLLGAASKEIMVMCPLVLILFDRAFLSGTFLEALRKRWPLYLSLVIPVAYVVWAMWGHLGGSENVAAGFTLQAITPWEYLRTQPEVLLYYLRLCFWPDRLILDYGWPVTHSPLAIYGLGSIILLLVGLSLWATSKYPRLGFLGMAFFLVLAPTSSIMPISDLAFEHRMYLPLAAVVTLVVLFVSQMFFWSKLSEGAASSVALVLLLVVVGALSMRTVLRNREYHHPIEFWSQCIEFNPQNPRPYRILADIYQSEESAAALAFYHRALELNPKLYWIWIDLGTYYRRHGQPAEAIAHYQKATEILPQEATAYINISRVRMLQGDFAGAAEICRTGRKHNSHDPMLAMQLCWLLATADDDQVRSGDEAVQILSKLPKLPRTMGLQYLEVLSAAQAEAGQFEAAVQTAEKALAEARKIHSKRMAEFEARLQLYQSRQAYRMKAAPEQKLVGST